MNEFQHTKRRNRLSSLTTPLLIISLIIASTQAMAFTEEERLCATMYRSCAGTQKNSNNCSKINSLIKDLGYKCSIDMKRKVDRVFSCFDKVDEDINLSAPNWISVSWDKRDPKIFATCEDRGAETVRQCAVKKCKEKGGQQCIPACNPVTGKRLRSCRKGTNTYVASSDYGRFGCGSRYVRNGAITKLEYYQRELGRCQERTKTNDCAILKSW
jgi:hypothetical protein